MSTKGKFYRINLDVYSAKSEEIKKLPNQQQIILKTMAENCVDEGMRGSDIVDLAVEDYNLETRQKSTVLYAWYARSNENFGVYRENEKKPDQPAESTDSDHDNA